MCMKGTVVESSAPSRPRPRPRFCAAFKNEEEEEEQSFIFKPSLRKGMIAALWALIILAAFPVSFAAEVETNSTPGHLLFTDGFGHSIRVFTNEVNSSLHPPVGVGLASAAASPPPNESGWASNNTHAAATHSGHTLHPGSP